MKPSPQGEFTWPSELVPVPRPTTSPPASELARTDDKETSQEAAVKASARAKQSQLAVMAWMDKAFRAVTSAEIAEGLRGQYSPSRVRGALSELEKAGSVKVVDDLGRTEYGNACSRYVLT